MEAGPGQGKRSACDCRADGARRVCRDRAAACTGGRWRRRARAVAGDLVNMSVGSEAGVLAGGLVDCDAVREMEVCWPSRVGLRRQALNRREGPWLKTAALNVVGKGGSATQR
jgi:hypothetical protein